MFERSTQSTTGDIVVRVEPDFLAEQSSPSDHRFIWAYTVEIENRSLDELQVTGRFWQIADSNGQVQEVRGAGVVGETPTLKPGETFRYTSGAPLSAPAGMMLGHYDVRTPGGETLEVGIPPFALESPHQARAWH